MQGMNSNISFILNQGNHYIIPGYQRNYQWSENLWQSLVSDIMIATTNPDGAPDHWLGILLTSQSTNTIHPGYSGQVDYVVIDGQQRLTTIAIWVAALVHHGQENGQDVGFELGRMAKLSVQESDRKAFQVVLEGSWRKSEYWELQRHQIFKAYSYFRYVLWLGQAAIAEEDAVSMPDFKLPDAERKFEAQWGQFLEGKKGKSVPRGSSNSVPELLHSTLQKLSIFSLIHSPATDESQAVIFDTLNGKHQELEPLDHVRNSLFVRVNDLESTDLYREFWYPAETALRKVALKNMKPGKAFIYDYVISKGEKKRQKNINATRGFAHFATMIKGLKDSDIPVFIKNDLVPAMLTWQVVVRAADQVTYDGVEKNFSQVALQHMSNIRDLSVGPANPVVLHYATGFVTGTITESNLVECLFLLENFLVRQILGGRAMSPLRARLMDVMGAIDGDHSLEKLASVLQNSDWVSDRELGKTVVTENLYESATPKALGAIFRGIERSLSGAGAMKFTVGNQLGSYSIEHIYPQRNSLWLPDLEAWGCSVESIESRKHTLGNLTIATKEHNSAVGNKPFAEKRLYPTGLGSAAPLSLNKGWLDLNTTSWTTSKIESRSIQLLAAALQYWKAP
jgi:hypothetical protein